MWSEMDEEFPSDTPEGQVRATSSILCPISFFALTAHSTPILTSPSNPPHLLSPF
jgi:hypothetical protein